MTTTMTMALAIAALAVGIYLTRFAGPVLRERITVSDRVERLLSQGATVVLFALVVTTAFVVRGGFAGWALPSGILVAGVLAWKKAPFIVVVVAAAAVTGLLRAAGVE